MGSGVGSEGVDREGSGQGGWGRRVKYVHHPLVHT